MQLHFQGLGAPRLLHGERWLKPPPDLPLLLLAFVAASDAGVTRGEVVACFWPGQDARAARHNLSQLLYRHREQPWRASLEVGRNHLVWTGSSDLYLFRRAMAEGAWHRAVDLYRGEFLSGVHSEGAFGAGTWLEEERRVLHDDWCEACLKHATGLDAIGRHGEASTLLARILQRDLLDENVLQAYMKSSTLAGRRDQALEAYEAFRTRLSAELEMNPLAATAALAAAIHDGKAAARLSTPAFPSKGPPAAASAPGRATSTEAAEPSHPRRRTGSQGSTFRVTMTPFVGRDIEQAELATALATGSSRILTLVGPGGMGKSRLAEQVAVGQESAYADGVHFVSLAPIRSPRLILPAIADSVGLKFGDGDPPERLSAHLVDKEMLLVLDNFEHLLEGRDLIAELLEACAGIQVLVTSREPLGFGSETLYELGGLGFPMRYDDEDALVYDSAQLFLGGARRISPGFTLTARDRPAVARICQLLQGIPIALELAAAWMRLLTPAELASELARNLNLLETTRHDLPARHRSVRAVFQHSWALLSAVERSTLKRLAVFRDGFDKEAAQAVTMGSLRTLLSLANKSLLTRTENGRFELFEIIRHCAEEKLGEDEKELFAVRRRHAEYFAALAEEAEGGLGGRDQASWLQRLDVEHDNLRTALAWTEREDGQLGLRLAGALWHFWHVRGHLREGTHQLMTFLSLEESAAPTPVRAKALRGAGILQWMQGNVAAASTLLEEALSIARAQGDDREVARLLNNLGLVAYMQKDDATAKLHLEACLPAFRAMGDRRQLAGAIGNLGLVTYLQGDDEAAKEMCEQVLGMFRELEDDWSIATSLNNLGRVLKRMGEHAEAEATYHEGLRLAYDAGAKRVLASMLEGLAGVAVAVGAPSRAVCLLGAAEAVRETIGALREPVDAADHESDVASLRLQLDRISFGRGWRNGREMSMERVMEVALGGTEDRCA